MIEIALAFLAGLLIGSFLNVCVFRLPRDLSVINPTRSFCPYCEKTISWYDNIPVLSYILLRAKCRNCGERIGLRYPAVELATALGFAACVAVFGATPTAFKYSLFSAILITLIASDYEERILPDEFTLGGTAAGLLLAYFVPMQAAFAVIVLPYSWGPRWISVGEALIGAFISSGSIWFAGWIYQKLRHREGLGFGDVKMIMMIGAFLGLPAALLTLIGASVVGAFGGLIYIKLTHQDASTYELPFGSFLGVTGLAVAAYGEFMLRTHPR